MAGDVFSKERFLKPKYAALGKNICRFQSDVQRVTLIRVSHHDEVSAQLFAHGANHFDVLIKIETDLDFHAVKTLVSKSPGSFSSRRRLFGVKSCCIYGNLIATLPT